MEIRTVQSFTTPHDPKSRISNHDAEQRERDDELVSFQTTIHIRLDDFRDVDESNPRTLTELSASNIESMAESNVLFSIKNKDLVPEGIIIQQVDERTMQLVATAPVVISEEQAEDRYFAVLIEAVSETDPDTPPAFMRVVVKFEEELIVSFETRIFIQLRDFFDVDESNPRTITELSASTVDASSDSNILFSMKNRDIVPEAITIQKVDEHKMQLVAKAPIIVSEEQAQSGHFPVLVEAVSETNSDMRAYMRIDIRIEDTNPSSTEVACEDPDMERMFCLNGGKCIQLKAWYDYDADPDNYRLSRIYCHCAKGWTKERCDARTYPLNRANKMKVNDADRERV